MRVLSAERYVWASSTPVRRLPFQLGTGYEKTHAPVHCGPSRGPPRPSAALSRARPSCSSSPAPLAPRPRPRPSCRPTAAPPSSAPVNGCEHFCKHFSCTGHCHDTSDSLRHTAHVPVCRKLSDSSWQWPVQEKTAHKCLRVVDDSAQAEDEGGRARGWTARLRAVPA